MALAVPGSWRASQKQSIRVFYQGRSFGAVVASARQPYLAQRVGMLDRVEGCFDRVGDRMHQPGPGRGIDGAVALGRKLPGRRLGRGKVASADDPAGARPRYS